MQFSALVVHFGGYAGREGVWEGCLEFLVGLRCTSVLVHCMLNGVISIFTLGIGLGRTVERICVCARLYGTLICWRESIPVYIDEPYAYIGFGDEGMIYSLR